MVRNRGPLAVFVNTDEQRLRAPWRIGLWTLALMIGLQVISAATVVLPSLTGPSPGVAIYNVARQTGILGAIFALSVGIGWIIDRRRLSDYGLDLTPQWLRDAGFGLGIGFTLPTLILLAQIAFGYTTITGFVPTDATDMFAFGSSGPGLRLGLLLMFFLVQATFEEFLIRGYLLTNIAEGLSGWLGRRATVIAVVVTGGLFGVLHWRNPSATPLSALNISLYGVLLGGCYVCTGQLGIATGFHIAWNYTLALWDFPVSGLKTGVALIKTESSGPNILTGGSFGPEGGLLAVGAFVVGTAGVWWWLHREYDRIEIITGIRVPDLRLWDDTDRTR
jgi:membrane protease YdiL (CAAX protease family)